MKIIDIAPPSRSLTTSTVGYLNDSRVSCFSISRYCCWWSIKSAMHTWYNDCSISTSRPPTAFCQPS